MLGDSLVEWGDWKKLLPETNVINRGMAGEMTEGLAARLIFELKDCDAVDAVLLQSGTNNLLLGYPHFPAIHSTMIPTIRSFLTDCPVIINSLMPMPVVAPAKITDLNEQLRDLARQHDNCYYLDMVQPFNERCLPITHPGFLSDQVHLSTRGYQVWGDEIKQLLHTIFS